MKDTVLVFHPGIQHSHQFSWALNEAGLLRLYITGVPTSNGKKKSFAELFSLHHRFALIPADKKFQFLAFSILRRIVGSFFGFKAEQNATWLFDIIFDSMVAVYVRLTRPPVVVGYQNACLFTFRQTKKYGGKCILDAAAMHQSKMPAKQGSGRLAKVIEERKVGEQQLADMILCCSDLAREGYLLAGVGAQNIHSIPLGVELPSMQEVMSTGRSESNTLHVIYAGSVSRAKGVDLLINAVKKSVEIDGCDIVLTLVGRIAEQDFVPKIEACDWIRHVDFLEQRKLFSIMMEHDLAVLFSRGDSFGMVVPEAMGCGCPVIVSEHVGAKEIIERFPEAGWVLKLDEGKLAERLTNICNDRDGLGRRKDVAIAAAHAYTWQEYRAKIRLIISRELERWGTHDKRGHQTEIGSP
ncbi:glycosyltransferase family 4 protein [Cupriavidus sp. BIC8F]|uniref:glycosyltransferase family 4 protein n=1 Tax=Cupriavidus sp. BIC8F TaxID=3079014 RepID=UPI0029160C22|nr:glycosyltransferase family 4 protein [Cupriavidus sp. BIC8F]